jgi:hypothetical protein
MYGVSFDRFQEPDGFGAKIICKCACGCGEEITEGYEHVNYDGEWFYETECFLKYMGAIQMEAIQQ